MLKVALPPVNVPVPMEMPASKKVTAPVGVPAPGAWAETVAETVTAWPKAVVLADVLAMVAVLACPTVCVSGLVVLLLLKLPSPLYVALMVCEPAISVEIWQVATPLPLSV